MKVRIVKIDVAYKQTDVNDCPAMSYLVETFEHTLPVACGIDHHGWLVAIQHVR